MVEEAAAVVGAFVGIDVSKKGLDAARLEQGGRLATRRFANTPAGFSELLEWCGRQGDLATCHFCLESTGGYGFGLACRLADAGLLVSVENPRFVKHYGVAARLQNKTDKADARTIAHYCRAMRPRRWRLAEPALRELDLLLKRLSDLEGLERQEANRLEDPSLPECARRSVQRMVRAVRQEREEVLGELEAGLGALPEVRAMVGALVREPGVGELTALRVLSHAGWDPAAFESAQQCAAAAGLNPVKSESGQWQGRTRISKRGPARLRGALHMAAAVAARHNPRVRAFYERLLERGLPKLAALTACARKLLMLCFGILKAHARGQDPVYSGTKARYTDLRGRLRTLHPSEKGAAPLTL